MQAVLLEAPRDVRVATVEDPVPAAGELLLEVAAVGICGSDLHYYLEGAIGSQTTCPGFIPGHEFACRVIDPRGAELGFPPGTLVAVDPARACGACEWCHAGHPNLCPTVVFKGVPPHAGAMAERIAAPVECLFPLPEGFDAVDGLMLEPLGVAVHAVALARPRLLESCAVLGLGPIGLLLLQVARCTGAAPLLGVDPVAERREAARELGADAVFPEVGGLLAATGGRGTDLVLEATDSPEGFALAAEAARIGGRIVLVGIPEGNRYGLDASLARRKGLTVRLSRRMGHVYPRAIELLRRRLVDVRRIVTHRFPLARAPEAFAMQAARRGGILKAVLFPNGTDSPNGSITNKGGLP